MDKLCEVQVSYRPKLANGKHPKIISSKDIADLRWEIYDENEIEYREAFVVLFLNQCGRILGLSRVSEGGISQTIVDVKMIMQRALLTNSSVLALVHNHPSGDTRPSIEDDGITRKITDAAKFFDIRVIDHVILTEDAHYSYADHGRI